MFIQYLKKTWKNIKNIFPHSTWSKSIKQRNED